MPGVLAKMQMLLCRLAQGDSHPIAGNTMNFYRLWKETQRRAFMLQVKAVIYNKSCNAFSSVYGEEHKPCRDKKKDFAKSACTLGPMLATHLHTFQMMLAVKVAGVPVILLMPTTWYLTILLAPRNPLPLLQQGNMSTNCSKPALLMISQASTAYNCYSHILTACYNHHTHPIKWLCITLQS